jgi:hypothetical protein
MLHRCDTCHWGARVKDVLPSPVFDDGKFRVCVLDGHDGILVEAGDRCPDWAVPTFPLSKNAES